MMQQTPRGTGTWEGIQFTEEPVEECDYLIILNKLEKDLELRCPTENVWRIVQEPPTEFLKGWHVNPLYSYKTFTCDPGLSGPQYIRSHPMLPWHVNRDYDFLAAAPVPGKPKTLSWITSTRKVLPGHKKRMDFLDYIKKRIPELDLLGGNIKHIMNREAKERIEREQRELGFTQIEDKWQGLAPYQYALAIESHSGPDYWTEKIADCFLAWTVPIYYGCTNLEDYFPKESFIGIDIEKPGEALALIKKTIKEDCWEERLPAIEKARELVLNKYQFFPFISDYIHSQPCQETPGESKKMRLTPCKPGISVVICTYNREQLLPGCLESLANQGVNKDLYEVLIIDNNSSDNTREVANEFIEKNSNFRSLFEKKQGLSHARNLGLKEAKADYVGFIDDDARLREDWIEEALKIINEKNPDIFGGPAYPIFKNGKPGWFKDEYGTRGDMGETGWLKKGFLIGTNMVFKKSLLWEYGGFDPGLGMIGDRLGYGEDADIVFRALEDKKKVYYSKELAVEDLLPDYKRSLAFFIYSRYKSGKDQGILKNQTFKFSELPELLNMINSTFGEFDFALRKRDIDRFPYPENYIIEKLRYNFVEIGKRMGYFLREGDLTPEKFLDSLVDSFPPGKIVEKITKRQGPLKTILEIISYRLKHGKPFNRFKKKPPGDS